MPNDKKPTYEALYRKYRPQTFADLAGQDPVANTLRNEIRDARLTHAYLFTGPRGTGKTTTARLLAKALNCVRGPTVDPCGPPLTHEAPLDPQGITGECPQCHAIRMGNHLDVVEIDAASNRGIEDIRSLQERVRLAPVLGRYKVFIIDEVHMLTDPAWNALLKTLEEPPPNCVFVLATTEVHKVLATVLSRCQRFDFQRISQGALQARLTEVAQLERLAIDPEALDAIARRADGGLRDALSLLDQVAAGIPQDADGVRSVTADSVVDALGLIPVERVLALGDAIANRNVLEAVSQSSALLANGHDHRAIVRELLVWARNVLLLQLAPDKADVLEIPASQRTRLGAHGQALSRPELLAVLETLRETDQALRGSSQATIWLEMGLLRLCERVDIPSLTEMARRIAALEAGLVGTVPVAQPVSGPPKAAQAIVRPPAPPADPGEGGSFGLALQADARLELAVSDPLARIKSAAQSLRNSLRSLFDQVVTGAILKPDGTLLVYVRQDALFKEGREGYKALVPIVRQAFGESTRLEISTAPPKPPNAATALPAVPPPNEPALSEPAQSEPALHEPSSLGPSSPEPAVPDLSSSDPAVLDPEGPQSAQETLPRPPLAAGRTPGSDADPVHLASQLLLGKIVEG